MFIIILLCSGLQFDLVKTTKLKIKTSDGTSIIVNARIDHRNTNGSDYMEMKVDGEQTVVAGRSVNLSCTSERPITKCFFFRPGGKTRYQVEAGNEFNDGRITCLCDVC